jgi:hypothetical protein
MKITLRAAIMMFSIGTISTHCRRYRRILPGNTVHIGPRWAVLFGGGRTSARGDYDPERRRGAPLPDHQPPPATGCSSKPRTAASADHLQQRG